MPEPQVYGHGWYVRMEKGAERSARAVLPMVIELVRPQSVVDVGCGTGEWLKVLIELGVSDVEGVDGDTVPTDMLKITEPRFHVVDLERERVALGRTFDLAMSLEVAEHLPEERADDFVDNLVSLAPAVMFSAAIPGQGGTRHVNEQWPDYWARRFRVHDYVLLDVFRPRLWNREHVEYWYAQNTFLYVRRDRAGALGMASAVESGAFPLRAVHPALLAAWVAESPVTAGDGVTPTARIGARLRRRILPRGS